VTTTTALLRPCMWGLALAGLLMTSTPAAAVLPIAVLYADQTEVVALASPKTEKTAEPVRAEMPRREFERVADAQIHQP